MGKSNTQQTSFTAGELSPLILGRADTAKYQSGAATVENFVVRPQGPLWKRGGTTHISRMWRYGFGANLIRPFVFSSSEAYLLDFGDSTLLIRDQGGLPVAAASPFAFGLAADSGGTAELTTFGAHGLATGDAVYITLSDVATYSGLWQVTVTGATTFILNGSVFNGTSAGAGYKAVILAHPYAPAAFSALSFAQSADTLFICHKNYKPRKLTRSSATSWTISEFTTVDGPYLDYNKDNVRLTVSSLTDTATVTANAAMAAGANQFVVGDINDWVEFLEQNEWRIGMITAVASVSSATIDISDKMLLGIAPEVRLKRKMHAKGTDGSSERPPSRGYSVGEDGTIYGGNPWAFFYRPLPNVPGVSPDSTPPQVVPDSVDPNVAMDVAAGVLTASHSNVFSPSDIGKDVRRPDVAGGAANSWFRIDSLGTGGTAAAVRQSSHYVANVTTKTMKTYTYPTEAVTLNANSRVIGATLTASSALFASTDVGRHIRMNFSGQWVYAKISAYTSSTVVSITLYDSFPRSLRGASRIANDGITDVFRLGAWYGSDTTGNYPAHVTFHEQRLVFAGSPAEPQTIWFSRPQDFNKMSPSEMDGAVTDDSAINVTLASNKVNAITWLQSAKVLLVGTIGGEWQGRAASSITEPITPTNIAFTEETTHGSLSNCPPLKIGSAVLFIQRSGQKLRELTYNYELDGWSSRDLTVASEHILRKGTQGSKMVFQNEPHSIIWIMTTSGTLAAMTYQREQEVMAWHYHQIGGSGFIESIAAIPNSSGTESVVFLAVKRNINGGVERYLEKLSADHYPSDSSDKDGFCYADSLATETMGGSGTTWDAFPHLIGEDVVVLKDGVLQGTFEVNSDGEVTGLTYVNGSVLTGGLAYTAKLKSLPIQGGSPFGSADMTKKRVARLFLRVYNSINAKVGKSESALQLKTFDGAVGSELLYTGDVELNTNLDYSSDGVFHVQSSDPYPLILLSTVAQVVANE